MSINEDLCLGDKAKGCDIQEVVRLLSRTSARQAVVDKWPVLAAQLKTDCDTRNRLKTGKYVMEEILQVLFEEWVSGQSENAKLIFLIDILELEAVNLNDLARILRRKYFPHTLSTSTSVTEESQTQLQLSSASHEEAHGSASSHLLINPTESPIEANEDLSEDKNVGEKHPLKVSDDCRVDLETETSADGNDSNADSHGHILERRTPSIKNNKMMPNIIFAVIGIVLILLICINAFPIFSTYKTLQLRQKISKNLTPTQSPDQKVTVTVDNYKVLSIALSKYSVNSEVFLVVDLRNSIGWPINTVIEIQNADSVVEVEFIGIRFSNSKIVKGIIGKTGFIRALYLDDFPDWDKIIYDEYNYMRLKKIVINKTDCNSDDTKYHVYTLSDKFNSTFNYLEEFNVTCGCLAFGKRYQIFDCVNLKKLYLNCILYDGTSYYDLGINNKLPNVQEIEIDNLKFSACPITARLEGVKEEKNIRNKKNAIHIKICSNCILDPDRSNHCI